MNIYSLKNAKLHKKQQRIRATDGESDDAVLDVYAQTFGFSDQVFYIAAIDDECGHRVFPIESKNYDFEFDL